MKNDKIVIEQIYFEGKLSTKKQLKAWEKTVLKLNALITKDAKERVKLTEFIEDSLSDAQYWLASIKYSSWIREIIIINIYLDRLFVFFI